MKSIKLIAGILITIILAFFLITCSSVGGDDGVDNGENGGDSTPPLTSTERSAVNDAIISAFNEGYASMDTRSDVVAKFESDEAAITSNNESTDSELKLVKGWNEVINTCNGTNYQVSMAINKNYTQPCPSGGHVNHFGNLKVYCTSWNYYTDPSVYCACTGEWRTSLMSSLQYGDLTNNLYDCDIGGIIIKGTLYLNASGTADNLTISLNGTLGINRRGPYGGLVMVASDFNVNISYNTKTQRWSGSIDGHPIS